MALSKDLTDQFKEKMQQSQHEMDITFSVMVLGTNFWPLNSPQVNYNIPKDILPTYERFGRYYNNKHSGRKLTWLWNYSKNELYTKYLPQKYILMTSSYQMAVLVQYNDSDTLSLDEIANATGMTKDFLSQIMVPLVKSKILINEESEQFDLNPCMFFFPFALSLALIDVVRVALKLKKVRTLILGFESILIYDFQIRINLNQPIKSEVKAESTDVLKTVDEDRKFAIQASIVR
jgi:cullin 1